MFTPTLRCECAQPGLIDTMRKRSISLFVCLLACLLKQESISYKFFPRQTTTFQKHKVKQIISLN